VKIEMDKQSVISFFDNRASRWDEISVQKDSVLNKILDYAGVKTGVKLLDVACGTGVLFDKYIERGVKNFTAIDISPEMVKKAQEKYNEIDIVCGDAEEYNFEKRFDCIIVFNAFPHFVYPNKLVVVKIVHNSATSYSIFVWVLRHKSTVTFFVYDYCVVTYVNACKKVR
jgi:demethylmenaquinone methyltransferase/2-methoxy-6-polyprenyl-1,4-benzoquinol methylase